MVVKTEVFLLLGSFSPTATEMANTIISVALQLTMLRSKIHHKYDQIFVPHKLYI